jgi:hypothetical protein
MGLFKMKPPAIPKNPVVSVHKSSSGSSGLWCLLLVSSATGVSGDSLPILDGCSFNENRKKLTHGYIESSVVKGPYTPGDEARLRLDEVDVLDADDQIDRAGSAVSGSLCFRYQSIQSQTASGQG